MTLQRKYKLIWLLLPLLVLRGLVPAGFMIDMSHGHLAMVVCPGHVLAAHGDASVVTGGGHHSGSGNEHDQAGAKLCPFSVAAGAGPVGSATSAFTASHLNQAFQVVDLAAPNIPFGPARAQQSRAPPQFTIAS